MRIKIVLKPLKRKEIFVYEIILWKNRFVVSLVKTDFTYNIFRNLTGRCFCYSYWRKRFWETFSRRKTFSMQIRNKLIAPRKGPFCLRTKKSYLVEKMRKTFMGWRDRVSPLTNLKLNLIPESLSCCWRWILLVGLRSGMGYGFWNSTRRTESRKERKLRVRYVPCIWWMTMEAKVVCCNGSLGTYLDQGRIQND